LLFICYLIWKIEIYLSRIIVCFMPRKLPKGEITSRCNNIALLVSDSYGFIKFATGRTQPPFWFSRDFSLSQLNVLPLVRKKYYSPLLIIMGIPIIPFSCRILQYCSDFQQHGRRGTLPGRAAHPCLSQPHQMPLHYSLAVHRHPCQSDWNHR